METINYTIENDGSVVVIVRVVEDASTTSYPITLAPGDYDLAAALIEPDDLATVRTTWTNDVIAAWYDRFPDYQSPSLPLSPPPTIIDRINAVEEALLDLMLGGG